MWVRLALFVLFLAPAAYANDLADNKTTKGMIEIGKTLYGNFDFDQDIDWYKINLVKGQHYAFGFRSGASQLKATLRDASGKAIVFKYADYEYERGFQIRAKYTGVHFVAVYDSGNGIDYNGEYVPPPRSYRLRVTRDCPNDPATSCSLQRNKTIQALLTSADDVDWHSFSVKRGYTYFIEIDDGDEDFLVSPWFSVVDASGRVFAEGEGSLQVRSNITGKLFLRGASQGEIDTYRMTLR